MAIPARQTAGPAVFDAAANLAADSLLSSSSIAQLGALIFENNRVQIFQAQTDRGVPVIVKRLRAGMQSIEHIAMLRREHDLLTDLKDVPVRKSYGLVGIGGLTSLLLEDVKGDTLRAYCVRSKATIAAILALMTQLCDVLAVLHSRGIVHKDINPQNILVSESGARLVLIDFGIAARMSNEQVAFESVSVLEGTLAYISPEQTGRTGHTIDERSDLYAVGATLYELLSGQPPFDGGEAIDIVHAHLATLATPLHKKNPQVPLALSAITSKLLAKAPEDRYCSAVGLKYDLERVMADLAQPGTAPFDFPLGQRDIPLRLRLPQQLYGRGAELEKIARCWERVEQGGNAFVAIGGPSGVGKTALIRELSSSILRTRAHFIAGKFEELRRDIPYDAVLQACLALIGAMQLKAEAEVAAWRERLRAELGTSSAQIVDLLPDLARILPAQESASATTLAEAKYRLQQQFIKFFRATSGGHSPLVLFLDDLQWADMASLELLDEMVMNAMHGGVYVIGAFRDNELSATHALTTYLATWRQHALDFEVLSLPPIAQEAVGQLCAAALQWQLSETHALANVVHSRTSGNPFFVRQLLKTLYGKGLIYFDLQACRWCANQEAIEQVAVTDQVVDLLKSRLKDLPLNVQHLLVRAAYLGDHFDLKQVWRVYKGPLQLLYAGLHHAVTEELLIPRGGHYGDLQALTSEWDERHTTNAAALSVFGFMFPHDRIQEACQHLLDDADVRTIRLGIARVLIAGEGEVSQKDRYDALYHFNAVEALVTNSTERVELARLNLEAGQRASQSSAWDIAATFYRMGMTFLGEQGWASEAALMRSLHLGVASALMLLGDSAATDRCFDTLLAHSQPGYQRAEVHHQRCVLLVSLHRNNEAIDAGVAGLKELGVRVPFDNPPHVLIPLMVTKTSWQLSRFTDQEILSLPEMTDPAHLLIGMLFNEVIHPCLMIRETLAVYLVTRAVAHVLEHGQSPYAAVPFLYYSVVLGGVSVVFKRKFWWGDDVRRLQNLFRECSVKWPNQRLGERMELVYTLFSAHWHSGYTESLIRLEAMATAFVDRGDVMFASYAVIFQIDSFLFNGLNLAAAEVVVSKRMDCVEHFIKEPYRTSWNHTRGAFRVLHEGSSADLERYGNDMTMLESGAIEELTSFCADRLLKATLLYLGGAYASAYGSLREAQRAGIDKAFAGSYKVAAFHMTMVLVAAEYYLSCKWWQCLGPRFRIWLSRKMLRLFTLISRENFAHKEMLANAVWAATSGRAVRDFSKLFEQAIAGARESGVVLDEALACERYGRALLRNGLPTLAVRPLINAIEAYEVWGATGKVKELESIVGAVDPQAVIRPQVESTVNSLRSTQRPMRSTASMPRTTSQISASLDAPTLVRAFQALSGEVKLDTLKHKLINLVCENSGARRALLLWRDESKGSDREQYTVAALREVDGSVRLDVGPPVAEQVSMAAVAYVSRSGKALIVADVTREEPWKFERELAARNTKSLICMPIGVAGVIKGVLYLENDLSAQTFTHDRVQILSLLSGQMAISLENAHLYDRLESSLVAEQDARRREQASHLEYVQSEAARRHLVAGLEAAEAVQQSLLVLDRNPANYQLSYLYVPAENAGGDWLSSFYDLEHDWLFLFLGDVTGHGISAALLTAAASGAAASAVEQIKRSTTLGQATVGGEASAGVKTPLEAALDHIAAALNAAVRVTAQETKQLMTMVMVGVDLRTGQAVYLNAGHPPILVGGDRARSVLVGGTPLGLLGEGQCGREILIMEPGEKILMFSDGLLGNVDDRGLKLRFSAVRRIFERHQEPDPVIAEIATLVRGFAHGPHADDTACLVFRWLGPGRA